MPSDMSEYHIFVDGLKLAIEMEKNEMQFPVYSIMVFGESYSVARFDTPESPPLWRHGAAAWTKGLSRVLDKLFEGDE